MSEGALRQIVAKFTTAFDTTPLDKGAKAIDETVGGLKTLAGGLAGALMINALRTFASEIMGQANAIRIQAQTLRMGTGELQRWHQVAELVGVDAKDLDSAFEQLRQRIGPKGDLGAYMEAHADRLSKIQDYNKRVAAGTAIFGASYAKLDPLLRSSREELKQLAEDQQELGSVIGKDGIKSAEQLQLQSNKLSLAWQGLRTRLANELLPKLNTLMSGIIKVTKFFLPLTKDMRILQIVAAALAIKGLVAVSAAIGPLGTAMGGLGKAAFKVILPLLLLQDLFTFFSGGKSLTGKGLDKMFGEGTGEKIRAWIKDVKREFTGFIDDIKGRPMKLIDDWKIFTTEVGKDLKRFLGPFWGGLFKAAFDVFAGFIDLLTGGWEPFVNKTHAIFNTLMLIGKAVWDELSGGFSIMVAKIEDAFTDMWNGILKQAGVVLKLVAKLGKAVGASDLSKEIADTAESFGNRKAGSAVAEAMRDRDLDRSLNARGFEAQGALWNKGRTHNETTVNITVPPTTPQRLARDVGAAAAGALEKVNEKNNQATKAALVPGGT